MKDICDRPICYADLDYKTINEEDLEDGKMLETAVTNLYKEQNIANLIEIIKLLRDSYVWVPYHVILSDEDQTRLEDLVTQHIDDLIGQKFVTHDDIRLIQDIVQKGDEQFFPVFSNPEANEKHAYSYTMIQKHLLEVISIAKNYKGELNGIVLNPYTEPFEIDMKLCDMINTMKSRIL